MCRVLTIAMLPILASCTDVPGTASSGTNSLLSATPATVASSATLQLRFSGELAVNRGGYYVLLDASGSELIAMNSDANPEVPAHSFLPTDTLVPVLDYGLTGPGPELISLPKVPPGQYQLCTLNSKPQACVQLTIV